ncbi:hypothetical protein EUGRSUZ_H00284 [Eucalyptus grandis]|uniref:Uncharacterized protein n=2 Tax=Eucalyptus grandis TaxID=71139 RepID=A0ACC3JKH2_EUCGR|nr:hypothetical protein EUGRSUZ_H00284 [Eucalyptus grandis]
MICRIIDHEVAIYTNSAMVLKAFGEVLENLFSSIFVTISGHQNSAILPPMVTLMLLFGSSTYLFFLFFEIS